MSDSIVFGSAKCEACFERGTNGGDAGQLRRKLKLSFSSDKQTKGANNPKNTCSFDLSTGMRLHWCSRAPEISGLCVTTCGSHWDFFFCVCVCRKNTHFFVWIHCNRKTEIGEILSIPAELFWRKIHTLPLPPKNFDQIDRWPTGWSLNQALAWNLMVPENTSSKGATPMAFDIPKKLVPKKCLDFCE